MKFKNTTEKFLSKRKLNPDTPIKFADQAPRYVAIAPKTIILTDEKDK